MVDLCRISVDPAAGSSMRNQPMSSSRLALISNDQSLARAIQDHLQEALGQPPFIYNFESIRGQLGPKGSGILLVALGSGADASCVVRLVQEIRLNQWPCRIVLIESDAARQEKDLSHLDAYVAGRLAWPGEAGRLAGLLKERLGRGHKFTQLAKEESLAERIGQQLLQLTPSLAPMAEPLALAASHDVTVLLTGETGTGKTYLARLIHECSSRCAHRLLVIPCGALVANLVESELFGHVKGAFTGADRVKTGKFEAAGDGTVLLDEIETLGLEQQANLLRVIETGEYEPVGSNRTQICTARIIAASNCNLEEAVDHGRFRQDLYYRLNVMSFYLPPLRERIQDIAPLARGMAVRYAQKFGKELFAISPEAIAGLEAYSWPGNIRQLENVMQQSVLMSSGPELLWPHLPKPIQEYVESGRSMPGSAAKESLIQNREEVERSAIQRALMSCGYTRARAASALGISRVTLYKKMKKYGLMEAPAERAQAV
jgi:two-component system, NtrC family, response regulator HydG